MPPELRLGRGGEAGEAGDSKGVKLRRGHGVSRGVVQQRSSEAEVGKKTRVGWRGAD